MERVGKIRNARWLGCHLRAAPAELAQPAGPAVKVVIIDRRNSAMGRDSQENDSAVRGLAVVLAECEA
jgi:hypothetical protein